MCSLGNGGRNVKGRGVSQLFSTRNGREERGTDLQCSPSPRYLFLSVVKVKRSVWQGVGEGDAAFELFGLGALSWVSLLVVAATTGLLLSGSLLLCPSPAQQRLQGFWVSIRARALTSPAATAIGPIALSLTCSSGQGWG
uniref:Uncharacterized protein n=1 Tax=Opuntia streptacantha TaxID=393608 RepID=A0A7C8YXN2_OPUST